MDLVRKIFDSATCHVIAMGNNRIWQALPNHNRVTWLQLRDLIAYITRDQKPSPTYNRRTEN